MIQRTILVGLLALGAMAAQPYETHFGRELPSRKVAGLITQVEGESMTISPTLNQNTQGLTGRLDMKKTRVTINGRAARPQDLKITLLAKGEVGLDDVWVSVTAERK